MNSASSRGGSKALRKSRCYDSRPQDSILPEICACKWAWPPAGRPGRWTVITEAPRILLTNLTIYEAFITITRKRAANRKQESEKAILRILSSPTNQRNTQSRVLYPHSHPHRTLTTDRTKEKERRLGGERRDVVLDDLLDLLLDVGRHVTGGDLLEEGGLLRGEVLTELTFPLGDLLDGDRVKLPKR